MSKKTRNLIVFLIICIVFITMIFIVVNRKDIKNNEIKSEKYYIELDNGAKQNISNKISEQKKIEQLDITKANIIYKDGNCRMSLYIENNTDKTQGDFIAKINILDKDKNVITNLTVYVAEILSGNTTEATIDSEFDFSNAYDYVINR